MAHHIKHRLEQYQSRHRAPGVIDEEEWLIAALDKADNDIRFRHLNPLDAAPLDLPGLQTGLTPVPHEEEGKKMKKKTGLEIRV